MDYCTAWFEGWWSDCCRLHDIAYTGTVDRFTADNELFSCVATSWEGSLLIGASSAVIAGVMWAGVRAVGWKFYKRGGKDE